MSLPPAPFERRRKPQTKANKEKAAKQKQGDSTPSDGWLCQFAGKIIVRMKYLIPNRQETQSPVDVTLGASCGDQLKNEM